ncbi:MAG: hypothetical protein EHM43_04075 [Ignavibacteriae bacterium]|nr:MAG: hypothetical protein EHM43_04075 [Ignavibacteriota bacterium]
MRNTRFRAWAVLAALGASLAITSCSEESTAPDVDDHEFITTIKVVVTDSVTESIATYIWEDLDGPGGSAPNKIDTMRFAEGGAYTAEVFVLNNSITPPDDFTSTIVVEGDVHQFFYTRDNVALSMLYLDKDYNNKPLGQKMKINSGAAGSGSLTIELSHYDEPTDKDGLSPSDETDVSVTFPVLIR